MPEKLHQLRPASTPIPKAPRTPDVEFRCFFSRNALVGNATTLSFCKQMPQRNHVHIVFSRSKQNTSGLAQAQTSYTESTENHRVLGGPSGYSDAFTRKKVFSATDYTDKTDSTDTNPRCRCLYPCNPFYPCNPWPKKTSPRVCAHGVLLASPTSAVLCVLCVTSLPLSVAAQPR